MAVLKPRFHFPFVSKTGVMYFFSFVFYVDTSLELIPPESFDASRQCSVRELKLKSRVAISSGRLVSNSCVCVCVV